MADGVLPGSSIPPAPPSGSSPFRGAFIIREAHRRWPIALRVGLCALTTIFIGWAAGDIQAGLLAAIGVFTASYGSRRPYLNRAIHLAVIAVCIAVAVALGVWASSVVWVAVLTVSAIAVVATFVCNALSVEPPGAYLFVLVCASGAAMAGADVSPVRVGVLVFAGGAMAWVFHMVGALFQPRGPEKAAVTAAGMAVAEFVEAIGTAAEEATQQRAAQALLESWSMLVARQHAPAKSDTTLLRLRALNREQHLVFAEALNVSAGNEAAAADLANRARQLAVLAADPSRIESAGIEVPIDTTATPIGRPGPFALLRAAAKPGSRSVLVAGRVGVAALLAGAVASAFGIDHVYWAISAAVLMLHGDLDWLRTVQKSFERLLGTWAGLLISGVILAAHPQGLWLAVIAALLKFAVQMTTVRNYALAVVFVTPVAMMLAFAGQDIDVMHVLLARGLDTLVGCASALVVFAVTTRHMDSRRLPDAIAQTLAGVGTTVRFLARTELTTPAARAARRDLHTSAMALLPTYSASVGGSPGQRSAAERLWPAVVATERLAYRMLATCWSVEQPDHQDAMRSVVDPAEAAELDAALAGLATAVVAESAPPAIDAPPNFIAAQMLSVRASLVWSKPGP
ncbi:FUSC family protein [Antrihabitans stalactiti]|uniref:FUSC family protein n=1 Tax=Antrihabitans stalactiti TaxID=2584121 RepID=A0A848KDP7_9NOCA|nr:FUSC family protein [Antrihabitans stalactiti]NMN95274.1 FUSC family protein [Antrihabitans stalactiti]